MIPITVFLVLSLHPQSPAAETLYPKANSVNPSDISQENTNAKYDAIVTNPAITLVFEIIGNLNPDNKLKKVD
jgi:hypothetical protein